MAVDPVEVQEEEVEPVEDEEVEEEPDEIPPLRGRRKINRKTGNIYVLNTKTGELQLKSRIVEYNRDTDMIFIYYWGDKTFRLRIVRIPPKMDKNQALRMALRALGLV
jgi:hypothetical protein